MDQAVNVAVVRSDNRRGAVAEALALIADDLARARHSARPHQAEPASAIAISSPRPTPTPSRPRSTPCSPPAPVG